MEVLGLSENGNIRSRRNASFTPNSLEVKKERCSVNRGPFEAEVGLVLSH